jgi:hypothetical protein
MATSLLPPGFDQPEAPVPPVPRARDVDASAQTTEISAGSTSTEAARDERPTAAAGHLLRYAPGMSLRDLAARTRLPQDELAALDRGDTSHCGGDFYLRAHLTCIASALQIEPDVLLVSFDRRPPQRLPDGTLGLRTTVRHRRRTSGKRILGFALIGLLVLGVAFAGYKIATRTKTPAAAAKHPAASAPVRHTTPRHLTPPPPVPAGTVAVALSVGSQPTWLLAQDQNGTTLFEGTVPAGTVQMLRGNAVHTVVGNAGAVTPTCNYHRGGVMGGYGQVVTMTFAPGIGGC